VGFSVYDICISVVVVNGLDTGKRSKVLTGPIFMRLSQYNTEQPLKTNSKGEHK